MENQSRAELEIRRLLDERVAAIRRKDARAVAASLAPDAIVFEMIPPLRLPVGAAQDVDGIQAWLSSWAEGPEVEIRDLRIDADGNLGLASSLNRLKGTRRDGKPTDLWIRSTLGLRRIGDEWRIVHAHSSVPFYPGPELKAALDLEPD